MSDYEIDVRKNFVVVVRKAEPTKELAYWHITNKQAFTEAQRLIEHFEPRRDAKGHFLPKTKLQETLPNESSSKLADSDAVQ